MSPSEVSWIPAQPVLFALPLLIYMIVVARRERSWAAAVDRAGLRRGALRWYGIAAVIAVAVGLVAGVAIVLLGYQDLYTHPNMGHSEYAGLPLSLGTLLFVLVREALYTNLGEELFFRGLLCGWLFHRVGYHWGNLVQSVAFLLPHMLVLLVAPQLWPFLIVVAVSAWLMGWLRYRSGSLWPAFVVHTVSDMTVAVFLLG
jgi:uncharacterized protein